MLKGDTVSLAVGDYLWYAVGTAYTEKEAESR